MHSSRAANQIIFLYNYCIDLASGRMTGACNTPFMDFFTADTKTIKSPEKLREGTNRSLLWLPL